MSANTEPKPKEKKLIPTSWVLIGILLLIDLQLLYVVWVVPGIK